MDLPLPTVKIDHNLTLTFEFGAGATAERARFQAKFAQQTAPIIPCRRRPRRCRRYLSGFNPEAPGDFARQTRPSINIVRKRTARIIWLNAMIFRTASSLNPSSNLRRSVHNKTFEALWVAARDSRHRPCGSPRLDGPTHWLLKSKCERRTMRLFTPLGIGGLNL